MKGGGVIVSHYSIHLHFRQNEIHLVSMLDQKPIVTYAGNSYLFSSIQPGLVTGLPTEAVEWKRSYGRASRQVYVECEFHPWSQELVSKSPGGAIQGQPVFHTFWTDVGDIDMYRQNVKEDIINWLRKIGSATDWMIVLVETPEGRKGNKFPLRTTVLDRIKQDVGGKTPERCVALTDPARTDSRAAGNMQSFLHKFRQLFLQSYNKVLNKFEENIRAQREKRNDTQWNFCQYFLLQEQLAFVYENLCLYDEALIQYDELDALFTQFILNSSLGDSPDWLERFNKDLSDWSPLSLDTETNLKLRAKLEQNCPSLMDMRNYLFSRQCRQLMLSKKPAEVAARSVSFLHNTAQELEILEVTEIVEGSLDCWVVLACLEVVQTCDPRTPGSSEDPSLTRHTAALWALARDKLLRLGAVCGLMPGAGGPSSDQLHNVISLTGCLPDTEDVEGQPSPSRRLKESLTSNAAFQKNYLEMCEIAISSFKYIGRIRSARLVGRDLATFYIKMGEHAQAASFLVEALKTFQQEKWLQLALETMLDLAMCYKAMEDSEKFARLCAQISSCPAASMEVRSQYFDQFAAAMSESGQRFVLSSEEIFKFESCSLVNKERANKDQIIPGDKLVFDLVVHNNMSKSLECDSISVALTTADKSKKESADSPESAPAERKIVTRSPSSVSTRSDQMEIMMDNVDTGEAGPVSDTDMLDMMEQLDYKQDKSLCSARLVCRNTYKVLKRKDSSGSMLRDLGVQQRGDYEHSLKAETMTLSPGANTVQVHTVAGEMGDYSLAQLSISLQGNEFLEDISLPLFSVVTSDPVVSLNKGSGELYAGLDNVLDLSVMTGSRVVEPGTRISLQASRGLRLRTDTAQEYADTIEVELPGAGAYQTISSPVHVRCFLSNQKDASTIEHRVQISDPWGAARDAFIHFTPAFYSTFQLLTAMDKKFLQIFLFPVGDNCFRLDSHKMTLSALPEELSLTPINSDDDVLVSDANCEAGYLWQLNIAKDAPSDIFNKLVKVNFTVNYKERNKDSDGEKYEANFSFQNFLTLYTIQVKVEPSKGNEFCRASSICPMTIQLEQCNDSPHTNLYYEVSALDKNTFVCESCHVI